MIPVINSPQYLSLVHFLPPCFTERKCYLTKFSSLAALEVVILTTSSAANDVNFVKMKTFTFQCCINLTKCSGQQRFIYQISHKKPLCGFSTKNASHAERYVMTQLNYTVVIIVIYSGWTLSVKYFFFLFNLVSNRTACQIVCTFPIHHTGNK